MLELELKAVVPDPAACERRAAAAGGRLAVAGRLVDRRWDTADGALERRDEVLRLRELHDAGGTTATLDWKGPTRTESGYKAREEVSTPVGDPRAAAAILERLGYVVSLRIDRDITGWELHGATVRFERYPHMDVLVEVEGEPAAIERAIAALGLPRESFTSEGLASFVHRFEERTGTAARLAHDGGAAGAMPEA